MGLDFTAVLGHKLAPQTLLNLPQRLSVAQAPRFARAIAELERLTHEYLTAHYHIQAKDHEAAAQIWTVAPTRLPLFRDANGSLTLEEPPARYEEISNGSRQIHFAPTAAWQPISLEEWWAREKPLEVDGPAINLTIGRHTLSIYSWLRWSIFRTEPTLQAALRQVCCELARILDSPLAIYLADGWAPISEIIEGATIDEIVAQLHTTLGPPKPTLALLTADAIGRSVDLAYYLDDFADL